MNKLIIATVVFLQFCDSLDIPPKPIYEIVANTESRKCYTCDGDCSQPVLTNCAATSRCYSKTVRSNNNQTIESRGCADSNVKVCESTDEELECRTCDGDFCNGNTFEDEDLGVSKCYVCIDECAKPAAQHDCRDVLEAIEGRPVKAACLSYQIQRGDEISVSKGCIPDGGVIWMTCLTASVGNKEIQCSICRSDLCNGEADDDEGSEGNDVEEEDGDEDEEDNDDKGEDDEQDEDAGGEQGEDGDDDEEQGEDEDEKESEEDDNDKEDQGGSHSAAIYSSVFVLLFSFILREYV